MNTNSTSTICTPIKIENVPITKRRTTTSQTEFLEAMRSLEVGQSFVFSKLTNNHFNMITHASILLDREFAAKKQPDGTHRVGRVS